jgi:ATP-binding cassette subfamily F protein uup
VLLTLKSASLNLGRTALLDKANLTLDAGERLCLMGRNGDGKSTLLKVIAGEVKVEG